jgi:AraC family transcriptional regulator
MLSAHVAADPVLSFPVPARIPSKRRTAAFRPHPRQLPALSLVGGGAWGARMAKHLDLPNAPAISVLTRGKAQLGVTRLRSQTGLAKPTAPFRPEQAFIVQLHLRNVSTMKLWQQGCLVSTAGLPEGGVSILDLAQDPSFSVEQGFDLVQFYIPRAALDEFADEHDARRCESLRWPVGKVDVDLRNLGSCLLPVLEEPGGSSELYVDHLVLAIHAYIARTYGGITVAPAVVRGGLAPWQLQRATEIMRTNLDGQISLAQIAGECKLSVSHFVRAFKQTEGQPPYRWLLQQRIEAAKELLLHSGLPMVEIALKCGFADQACFIRAFRKLLNVTPGEWRRMRLQ